MTGNQSTETKQAENPSQAPKPRDMRSNTDQGTKIIEALAGARRARHHRDCYCRRFDGQFCNAADALWSRAANRELEEMTQ
jgi:hypothetical protein